MSDDSLRRLEREWSANPDDQALLAQLVLERTRAGLPLTADMLEARALPEREFACDLPLQVQMLGPGERRPRGLGRTPGGGTPIRIPRHCVWWALPIPPGGVQFERLRALVQEESIPGLSFAKKKIDDRRLELFSGLDLTFLGLAQCKRVTDRGLEIVSTLKSLGWLDLERTSVTDAGLERLVELPQLFSLKVWAESFPGPSPITSSGVLTLSNCKSLKHLSLGCEVDRDALAALASLPRLQSLDLSLCQGDVSAEDLAPLGCASTLRELSLGGLKVSHLRDLKDLGELRSLGAPARIDADGLRALAALPRLERVELGPGTTITDELLEVLATFSALKVLDVGANTFEITRGTAGLPTDSFDLCYRLPPTEPGSVQSSLTDYLPHCKTVLPAPPRKKRKR